MLNQLSYPEMTSDVPSLGPAIASGNPGAGIQGGGAIVHRAIKWLDDEQSFADKERLTRENYSEIEQGQRNKMTAYITELSDMVPTCSALAQKPDNLTILPMAVSHINSL
uniref:BHLH domain-containing protein n=2 Tax=Panthera TaxID=9688 RepID=A0A8C8WAT7_PANLE